MAIASPPPSPSPSTLSLLLLSATPPISFSSAIIAIVLFLIAVAFLINLKNSRRLRFYSSSASSPNFNASSLTDASTFHVLYTTPAFSPNFNVGTSSFTDAIIKTILRFKYARESKAQEYVMCLFEFKDNEDVRNIPFCYHAYNADCIDKWLGLSTTCPLCRADVVKPDVEQGSRGFAISGWYIHLVNE